MTLRLMFAALGVAVLAAGSVWAKPPSQSPRPELRPGTQVTAPVRSNTDTAVQVALSASAAGLRISPKPVPRPAFRVRTASAAPVPAKPTIEAPAPERVVRVSNAAVTPAPAPPPKRPKGLLAAIFRAPDKPVTYPKKGSVCGDASIRGQRIPPIPARLSGCGLNDGVRITSVDGVTLTQPANVDCNTARALKRWVAGSVKPAVGRLGGGVASLKVAAHYSCRTRNNQPGAKISEHGRGKAIDISAIKLKNGTSLTVLRGWNDPVQGPILKRVHAQACGTFGTVLGPRSDRFHKDHFHFDTARHRGGSYCR